MIDCKPINLYIFVCAHNDNLFSNSKKHLFYNKLFNVKYVKYFTLDN